MKRRKGFIFIETIIVTAVLLISLMVVYSLYVSTLTSENRRLKYDDPPKLYETYYIKKYLESFDINLLKEKLKDGSKYEIIYQSRADIFGTYFKEEYKFFKLLWDQLHIRNIYFLPNDISPLIECEKKGLSAICSNKNLLAYLKTLDDSEPDTYHLVIEYAESSSGGECTKSDCVNYYANVLVGE